MRGLLGCCLLGLWACQTGLQGDPKTQEQALDLVNAGHYPQLKYLHRPFSGEPPRRDTLLPSVLGASLLLVELQVQNQSSQAKAFPPACLCRQSAAGEQWYSYRRIKSNNVDWHTADSLPLAASQARYRKNYVFELEPQAKGKLFFVPYCPKNPSSAQLKQHYAIRLGDVDTLKR